MLNIDPHDKNARTVTVLRTLGPIVAKRISSNGEVRAYDNAKFFTVDRKAVASLRELVPVLQEISKDPRRMVINGEPIKFEDDGNFQRLQEHCADSGCRFVWLDLDQEHNSVEDALAGWPVEFQKASYIVQRSGSYGIKPGARSRVIFELDRPLTCALMGELSKPAGPWGGMGIDRSTLLLNQPIYTAAPVFDDPAQDPCLNGRIFYIEGERGTVTVPDAWADYAPPKTKQESRALSPGLDPEDDRLIQCVKERWAYLQPGESGRHPTLRSMIGDCIWLGVADSLTEKLASRWLVHHGRTDEQENTGEIKRIIADWRQDVRKLSPSDWAEMAKEDPAKVFSVATVEAYFPAVNSGENDRHAQLVHETIRRIEDEGVTADALGSWRRKQGWSLASVENAKLAAAIATDLRFRYSSVATAVVVEVIETIQTQQAAARRAQLVAKLTGKPSTDEGRTELRRWLSAVCDGFVEADFYAMLHWLWQVKAKLTRERALSHLMIVLFGPQGSGKTEAVKRLVASLAELVDPDMSVDTLTDDRAAPQLAYRAVGVLDELAGMSRADFTKLKKKITADCVSYRPMATNSTQTLPHLCTFIGTSNKRVSDVLKDDTGNRRFYEITTADRCDWDAINAIDYDLLWTAVSEDDPAPGVVYAEHIARVLSTQRYVDPVESWLDQVIDTVGAEIDCEAAYDQFDVFCRRNGEKPLTHTAFGSRLRDLGWDRMRRQSAGERRYVYVNPHQPVKVA